MIKIRFLDIIKDREFEIDYTDNIDKARNMYRKCRYSKKLRVLQVICDTLEQYYYIVGTKLW